MEDAMTSSPSDTTITTTQHHTKLDYSEDQEQSSLVPQRVIPKELVEVEEVDMNDELMDPFEWVTRKVIPIPKQYYWEDSEDAPGVDPKDLPLKLKMWHRSVAAGGSALRLVDRMGKPVTGFLGLSSSRFDYVTSTMSERDWESSRQIVSERRKKQQEDQLEEGSDDQ
mmetsp:Transcript_32937/g.79682  ORF Transcript_32937/g.79682 Transcript_32937/m.79682 type:complete len:168 (+) Transcript_32937:120-623(+)|eukprot:CAMPEP_0113627930 /NCGR_PEP_ID=MMETSP0017_2-20120614/14467_1 /TAXON_ID=2856 /ORGANISM="Cylindrotheca closterium" /LENGTH=167 /DNA_ID=CAMNT_0000538207 /DNA_START=82 /DNA_END=585 /DNA_ORIENTATION=+ /assembly_acc=CAM_ASM_000147